MSEWFIWYAMERNAVEPWVVFNYSKIKMFSIADPEQLPAGFCWCLHKYMHTFHDIECSWHEI